MTLNEVIARALRLLGVVQAGEAATGNEYADGIETLNLMMAGLRLRSIDMGWQAYTTAQGGSTMPYPDEDLGYVSALLAMELASEYGKGNTVPATLVAKAQQAEGALFGKYHTAHELENETVWFSRDARGLTDRTLFT